MRNAELDGCHVHDHCLTCPLVLCIYDEEDAGLALIRHKKAGRDEEIVAALATGQTIQEVMRRHGVSYRTILKIKAEHKVPHTCAVTGCGATLRDDVDLCKMHTAALSYPVQQRLYRTRSDRRTLPSERTALAYREALAAAVAEISP